MLYIFVGLYLWQPHIKPKLTLYWIFMGLFNTKNGYPFRIAVFYLAMLHLGTSVGKELFGQRLT